MKKRKRKPADKINITKVNIKKVVYRVPSIVFASSNEKIE